MTDLGRASTPPAAVAAPRIWACGGPVSRDSTTRPLSRAKSRAAASCAVVSGRSVFNQPADPHGRQAVAPEGLRSEESIGQ